MEKYKLILILGVIVLIIGLILLFNGTYWYFFTQGQYSFTEAGLSRIYMSIPVIIIGGILIILAKVLKKK